MRNSQARNPGSPATQNLTRGILSLRDPAERLGHPFFDGTPVLAI